MNSEVLLFFLFSFLAIGGAVGVVAMRDPVKGALSLVGCFFCLSVLFLLQAAQLLAVLQVLVYAGAIMVLFVFVIMLVERHDEPILPRNVLRRFLVPVKIGAVALVAVNTVVMLNRSVFEAGKPLPADFGTARGVGMTFFNDFAFQFEFSSLLLLVSIVGAVILSKKDTADEVASPASPPSKGGH